MNPQTIGDIGLFACGCLCGAFAMVAYHEVRYARHVKTMLDNLKRSRRVCAWCDRDLGPTDADRTSHGLCASCASALLKEIQEDK